jgi:hypothetical protein
MVARLFLRAISDVVARFQREGFWIYAVQKRTLGSLCLSLYRARAKVFAHKRVHYWIRIIMCSIMFSFLCTMMMIMIIERVI